MNKLIRGGQITPSGSIDDLFDAGDDAEDEQIQESDE